MLIENCLFLHEGFIFSAARVTSCQDNGENIKQSQGFALSINSTIPIWEVTEQELKPFSSCDNALKSTLKLLADAEW